MMMGWRNESHEVIEESESQLTVILYRIHQKFYICVKWHKVKSTFYLQRKIYVYVFERKLWHMTIYIYSRNYKIAEFQNGEWII